MKWEVTISEFKDNGGLLYEVSRRIPELSIAETRIFTSKKQAKEKFLELLQ